MRDLTLAEKLKRLRGDVSQKEAAKRIGISAAALCRLERGQRGHGRQPNHWTLLKVAETYGVPVEYLESDLRTYMRLFARRVLLDPALDTPGKRLNRVMQELETRFGVTVSDLAGALGIVQTDLDNYRQDRFIGWPRPVFERLEELIGVSGDVIAFGSLDKSPDLTEYQTIVALAASHGLPPGELERLVRTWIDRDKRAK